MCTVTVIRTDELIRVACNRDEQRTRQAAVGPAIYACGDATAIYPIDLPARGTWIGSNDAGLTLALVNMNDGVTPTNSAAKSRGLIIPEVLDRESAADAMAAMRSLDLSEMNPFRLLAVDARETIEFRHDGIHQVALVHPDTPVMITSSGMGDQVVEKPRRKLFEAMFSSAPCTPQLQDAFHRHTWPDQTHLSVCMSREDARTVSFTVVDVTSGQTMMTYLPDAPDSVSAAKIVYLRHRTIGDARSVA